MWWFVLLMALLALGAAVLDVRRVIQKLNDAQAHLAKTQVAAAASAPTGPPQATDFTARLPTHLPSAAEVAALLQKHSKAAGARLLEFSSAEHAATSAALGRREVEVELAGSYPAVKRTVADVLASRDNSSSLRALRLRAEPEAGTLRARATLVFWSEPIRAAEVPNTTGLTTSRPEAGR